MRVSKEQTRRICQSLQRFAIIRDWQPYNADGVTASSEFTTAKEPGHGRAASLLAYCTGNDTQWAASSWSIGAEAL